MSRSIWSVLGIRATRDVGEIKRAYAAKLKAIDMDSDPLAFQSLREARDIAIRLAQQPFDDDPAGGLEDDGSEPGLIETDEAVQQEEIAEASEQPQEPQDPAERELNEQQQALCAILFDIHDDTFYAATPEEEQAMLRHFEAIAANPLLQQVDTLANGSQWFAGAIAQMIPRSDALIEPAARLFGWDQGDELGEDPALAAVMQRRADLRFRDEISQPGHRLHKAWNELTQPADENSRRGWISRKKVMELLAKVRSEHPTLERQFDWYRVELWENQAWWQQGKNYWWALWAIFIAIRIAIAVSDDDGQPSREQGFASPPTYEQQMPLSTAAEDIDRAIRQFSDGRIDGDRLQLENPKLYQLFRTVWHGKREANAPAMEFDGRVRQLLNEQMASQWRYADDELLTERFRLTLAEARSMAAASAQACSRFFNNGERQLHSVHREREADLAAKRILAIDPDEPTEGFGTTTSFKLPGAVVDAVSDRSGIKGPELSKALSMQGEALSSCKARLALLEVVLELPAQQRTAILRDMIAD